jgi:hypothetical protein
MGTILHASQEFEPSAVFFHYPFPKGESQYGNKNQGFQVNSRYLLFPLFRILMK